MPELAAADQTASSRVRLPAGGPEFLTLLKRLLHRPVRGERRLPLIWLVRQDGSPDLIALLRRAAVHGRRRRVPHAVVDTARRSSAGGAPPPTDGGDGTSPGAEDPGAPRPGGGDVATLLRELHRQLSLDAFGGERLRFRHYPLADWLMHQTFAFGLDTGDRRSTLVRRLRDRRGERSSEAAAAPAEDTIGTVYQFALWLIRRAIPSVVFRAAISGRVPLLGQHYRWFMRQQYLAPRQSATFVGFAERLTAGRRDGEQPEQVNKLLVHAFLEDLRQAYRRRPWRLAGWRRTAYPVVMLDNIAPGNAGHALIQLINDVRNETGRNDPLLVVAAGEQPPKSLPRPQPLTEADESYAEWTEMLEWSRRLRNASAWLIVLLLGDARTGPESRGGVAALEAPDPPWWSRRVVAAAAVLLLLAGGAVWVNTRWGPGCYPRPFGGPVSVELIGGECIGFSAGGGQVFNRDPGQDRLREIQRRIFEQNAAAEEVWERSERRRPLLTLIYLGTLTGNRTRADEESYVSEREELEGMATAQYALLKESAGADGAALLRIVIANGGYQMRHAGEAVARLEELARDDPTVLGVVGLVDSRTSTARALRELNRVGLPVLAPTLSADGIEQNSQLYLQISAPNTDQVMLVEQYARQVLRVGEAHVYYTTGEDSSLTEDLYVDTLVKGLRKRFGDRLTRVEEWRTGQRLNQECGYSGMLFFAGRWSEFDGFLRALKDCGANPPRHLVADDSVNRYMANPSLRASAPGNIPVTYVSKAALATCAMLRAARDQQDDVRGSFLTWIQADDLLDPPRCRPDSDVPVGERVSLAYDAATMMVGAVESLAARLRHADPREPWDPRSINPIGVHVEVLRQNEEKAYPGVAGVIRFPPGSGTPAAKRISLMRVSVVTDVRTAPVEVFHCGSADGVTDPKCVPVADSG